MKTIKARITFVEELLGTANSDPAIHEEFIASKAPDAPSLADEVAALGVEGVVEKGRTVFPKTADGRPFIWDYQIKGFFKDSCAALARVEGTRSKRLKAYKKVIDGCIFPEPRRIGLSFDGETGSCQRPLRAQTMQGERVTLANSETVPAGATMELSVVCLEDSHAELVREWLDYGRLKGLGQWRNSGKGRFTWEEIE